MVRETRHDYRIFREAVSLRARIFILLGLLVLANVGGAAVTLWYVHRTQELYTSLVDRDLTALSAAQDLEADLVMQKGYVTYYFLNNDPAWLKRLNEHHKAFEEDIRKARNSAYLGRALAILNTLDAAYIRYSYARDQVIELYRNGDREAGARLHWGVRDQFHTILDLCEQYKSLHEKSIARTQEQYREKAARVAALAAAAIPGAMILGLLLGAVLLNQVLGPIRRLAYAGEGGALKGDEIKALGLRVKTLKDEVDQSHLKLERSREHLVQTEKLAMVGKLSASVAHSIRNPLTSVKMRLFSLERGLTLSPVQKEDFEVISEEIRHLDTIIANFLEFSRPPRLKMQMVSISDISDNTLELLRHRLESYRVDVTVTRRHRMPRTLADPEQLKEVLVNLILNACDAMGENGRIEMAEAVGEDEEMGPIVEWTVRDSGPGIPPDIVDKIFDPFFSSKEEGTGLGLSIARRIVVEHGGKIIAESAPGAGACFRIILPVKEG